MVISNGVKYNLHLVTNSISNYNIPPFFAGKYRTSILLTVVEMHSLFVT